MSFNAYDVAGRLKTHPTSVVLTTDVSGVLPTANGGTSVDIASAALPLGSGQITFPASQNASADANTLDDYEEGTWTPVIGGSGGTSGQAYSFQTGWYVKVGRLVLVWFNVALSTLGTVTTSAQLQGLPFTVANVTNQNSYTLTGWNNLTTSCISVSGFAILNTSFISLFRMTAAGTTSFSGLALVQADLSNTTQLAGFVAYETTT